MSLDHYIVSPEGVLGHRQKAGDIPTSCVDSFVIDAAGRVTDITRSSNTTNTTATKSSLLIPVLEVSGQDGLREWAASPAALFGPITPTNSNAELTEGFSRDKLHELYVANEAELTKHVSKAAGATVHVWGRDHWSMHWYEAPATDPLLSSSSSSSSPSCPSSSRPPRPPSGSRGTDNGASSHSLVQYAAVPPSHAATAVDVVISHFGARRVNWVVGPGDDHDQRQLEIALRDRGLRIEDWQPIMVAELSCDPCRAPEEPSPEVAERIADYEWQLRILEQENRDRLHLARRRLRSDGHGSGVMYAGADVPGMLERSLSPGQPALEDYNMALMLLEQQNKQRLIMARQEQEERENEERVETAAAQRKEPLQSPLYQRFTLELDEMRQPQPQPQQEQVLARRERHPPGRIQKRLQWQDEQLSKAKTASAAVRPQQRSEGAGHSAEEAEDRRGSVPSREQYARIMKAQSELQRQRRQRREKDRDEAGTRWHPPVLEPGARGCHRAGWLDRTLEWGANHEASTGKPTDHPQQQQQQQQQQQPPHQPAQRRQPQQQPREPVVMVHTGVGTFQSVRKGDDEGDADSSEFEFFDAEEQQNGSSSPTKPRRDTNDDTAPMWRDTRTQYLDGGGVVLLSLLASAAGAGAWVRAWAHEAHGDDGAADVAHWTDVYGALMSSLPPSQFLMYVARDPSREGNGIGDDVIGTGYIHLHAGVVAIHGITVRPEYRGRGIGAALTRYGMRIGREGGAKTAMVTATRSGARVFDPLGFRHFGWVKLYAWRPNAEGAAAARARLLKADAEDDGWDWVSGAPPEC
ncbi:hypothetical protein DL764_010983 [Monosporascus ibericus]|uniref:N-acetyltransferase domain-containing protein n=1 Tax=Monosporascus ibericus TaxID=155417 RepID=A0A4Q4STK8_9PEZI|nr:hypothetical protein DL764_010983 [Monosporascus ibericus]